MDLKNLIERITETMQKEKNPQPTIVTARIGWGQSVRGGFSVGGATLKIGDQAFASGWGDHAQSRLLLTLPSPAARFEARVGVQSGMPFPSRAVFIVCDAAGNELGRSPELSRNDPAFPLRVELKGVELLELRTIDVGFPEDFAGTPPMANVNWCDPVITLADGRQLRQPDFVSGEAAPLIDFEYDGNPAVMKSRVVTEIEHTADLVRWRIEETTADGALTVAITLTRYRDFPVIEWRPELRNDSDQVSGIVGNFKALNLRLDLADRSTGYLVCPYPSTCRYPVRDVALRRTLGSKNAQNDFTAETVWLRPRYPQNHLRLDTDEGRSSAAWLPFVGLDVTETEGVNIGIGWSGAWYADFRHRDEQLEVEAGMMKTHFRVLPGEQLRQVSIFLHHRDQMSVEDGQNQLRRFLLKYHTPHRQDGSIVRTPLPLASWGGLPSAEMLQVIDLKRKHQLPFDTYWIDAGWFGRDRAVTSTEYDASDWATTVGYWRVNRVPHPEGLRPVSDAARAAGMKFLLWVEMERVMPDTPVAREHPEWLLATADDPGNLLLNLGDEAACNWAIDVVDRLVREEGIDYYRQDFNFNTIPFWADNDAPDRVGVTEMKYIAGLYRFWDTLRERFPDMLIDNCASGGRRIDFETNSRSICLYRSDMLGRPWYDCSEANQTEVLYLTQWVPLHAGGTTLVNGDDYGFFSGVASGVDGVMTDLKLKFDFVWYKEVLDAAKRMMEFFYFDFHLLTPCPESRRDIYSYQCHAPEQGAGFFIAFRRAQGDECERVLPLRGIDPGARYQLEFFRGGREVVTGRELQNRRMTLAKPRSMQLCFYTKLD